MTEPKYSTVQFEYQNPRASLPLLIPMVIIPNTPDEEVQRNITVNSARDLEWIQNIPEHDGVAVFVGGGGSIAEFPDKIKEMQDAGATVFAMNGASKWCGKHGIAVDYQCILDAKEETSTLVDPDARAHLIASQCNPKTMAAVENPIVWHCNTGSIEEYFPPERVARGGYVLLAGGSACGNSSLTTAYALGFRDLHIFGFDSCHRDGNSHAYDQPMNKFIPNVEVTWGDRVFTASVAMKAHAEDFQVTSQALKHLGCTFRLYGEGLLQTMYNTKPENLTERQKYKTLWQFTNYRTNSPGLRSIPEFLTRCAPGKDKVIIDFGCGTGKASIELDRLGYQVFLIDFADNCRDDEAMPLPFLEWDLTLPIPARAPLGLCTDVMEHIPPDDVDAVVNNIMASAETVFFQISCLECSFKDVIGAPLHLTVISGAAWMAIFYRLGYDIKWHSITDSECRFVVTKKEQFDA